MNSTEASVFYGSSIGVEAQPDVIIELTEQGPQGTHGEKGDKGDTGTVTPEMLAILEQTKKSVAEAADSLADAKIQVGQVNQYKNEAYDYYQQAIQVKIEIQSIKDAATRDVADAAKSLVELAANSEKAINNVTNPALTEIRNSKEAADAAINEVRQARDAAKSSADAAQTSAAQTATDASNVADTYNKITTIETSVTALADKTEAAEKAVDAMNKSVADNYLASQAFKSDIDAAKTAIDEQTNKVSQALSDAQKAAEDALKSATDAEASKTAAEDTQKAAKDAVTEANNAITIADDKATAASNAATAAKTSETTAAGYLSKTQILADKVEALKPEIDEAVEKNNTISDQISASKTAIEGLSASAQENANKAITAANNAATSETNVIAAAAQVATDKTTVVGVNTAVTNALEQVNTAKDSVASDLAQTSAAKAEVDRKLNEFSTTYYGASSTEPTGDIKLGALWLDTSQQPEVLKKYLSTGWEIVASTDFFTKSEVQDMFAELTAGQIKETDNAKIMTADEREKIAGLDKQIEDSCAAVQNACVTNSRIAGAVMLQTSTDVKAEMPSGYLVTTGYWIGGQLCMSGRQPQLYIKDIGWFPLGAW